MQLIPVIRNDFTIHFNPTFEFMVMVAQFHIAAIQKRSKTIQPKVGNTIQY